MILNQRVVEAYGRLFLTPLGIKDSDGNDIPKYIKSEEDRTHELQVMLAIREGYEEAVDLYIVQNG